jgi:hypothetical protein
VNTHPLADHAGGLPAPWQPANDHVKALAPIRYINVHASAAPQTKAEFAKAVEARRAADAKTGK